MKNGSYFIIKCPSSVTPKCEPSARSGCSDPDPALDGWISSTSLPCQQHKTPGANQNLGEHKISSHWTHYSVFKRGGHCVVKLSPALFPSFLVFPVKHLPVSTIWTCINNLNMILFWGVCQKLKHFCSNLSSRSAKANRDAAPLQTLWRAPCCGGHWPHKWKRVIMRKSGMGRRNGNWLLKKHKVWAAHIPCDSQG